MGFSYLNGSWVSAIYWARRDRMNPIQMLMADVLTKEPNANWREYRSTNHLAGPINTPAGGNIIRVEGSGQWINFGNNLWSSVADNAESRPKDSPLNAPYNDSGSFRNSALYWSAASNSPAGPKYGSLSL